MIWEGNQKLSVLIPILVCVIGCGNTRTSSHGWRVFFDEDLGLTSQQKDEEAHQLGQAVSILGDAIGWYTGDVTAHKWFNDAAVTWTYTTRESISVEGKLGLCGAFSTKTFFKESVWFDDCMATRADMHEALHLYLFRDDPTGDANHESSLWNTAEKDARCLIRDFWCREDDTFRWVFNKETLFCEKQEFQ